MVVPKKDKFTFLPKNLKFLRTTKGITLLEMASELTLSGKTSYFAYEQGRAFPDIFKLMKLASYFDVSVDDLLHKDLTNSKQENQIESDILTYELEEVPFSAAAGYSKGYGDVEYLNSLKRIKIPFKPYGIARAFKIDGDSMEPLIKNGSTVVGIKVGPGEVRDSKSYVIVTNEGLQCKHLEVGESDVVYLISANKKYKIKHVDKSEVKEIWEVWKTL